MENKTAPADDEARISKIYEIMTQAYGVQGRILSDQKANEILPGWLATLRSVPTWALEDMRVDGLERKCRTADDFLTVHLSGHQARAAEAGYLAQMEKLRLLREQAVQPGHSSESKVKAIDAFRKRGWV